MSSQITSNLTVCSTDTSGQQQRNHQLSTLLTFLREIHQSPVVYKGPVMLQACPWHDNFMIILGSKTFRGEVWFSISGCHSSDCLCVRFSLMCVYLQGQQVPSHISNGFLGTLLIIPWTSQIMTDGNAIYTFRNTIAMCHCCLGLTYPISWWPRKGKVSVRQEKFWKYVFSTCSCHSTCCCWSISRQTDTGKGIIFSKVLLPLLSSNVILLIMMKHY